MPLHRMPASPTYTTIFLYPHSGTPSPGARAVWRELVDALGQALDLLFLLGYHLALLLYLLAALLASLHRLRAPSKRRP